MKKKIFQSRALCLCALDTNSTCAKNVRRNEGNYETTLFSGAILLTTILLFAAACGKNTATETVPPQTQIASESDFSEETSMNGQTDSITPESSATDLIGNAPSETASGSNSNGNSTANGTAAETQDGLMSGKTSTVTGKIQEM